MSNVFITGSSTGFGFLTAQTLADAGHRVFASMRDPNERNAEPARALLEPRAERSGDIHVLELDVVDDASVEAAVARARELGGTIDVLINNAGIGTSGHYEAFTPAQFRRLFEVNLFGVQRMMRAVLPAMRERSEGLIIQVSSGLGRMVMPYVGPYNASKFALECLSEAYAMELAPTGVEVCILEPGAFATNFLASASTPQDRARVASYGPLADAPRQMWGRLEALLRDAASAPDPQLVADAIAKLIAAPAGQRPLRTVVDPISGTMVEAINGALGPLQAQLAASLGQG